MVLNVPAGIPAAGKLSAVFIPASGVADPSAITLAEINATGSVNASCHLMSDGYGRTNEQGYADRRRACQQTTYQVPSAKTVSWDDMRFVYDPQNPDAEVSEVYAALVEGEEYYVVERIGLDGKADFAADQYYDAYHLRLDVKEKLVPGDDGELEFAAKFSNLDDPIKDAQIVAA